jgi:hypothetical protein
MPVPVGFLIFVLILRRPGTMREWRGAACALALGFACACISPSAALAQASSDTKADASKPKAKAASPKKHVQTAGAQAKSSTAATHSKSKYASSHKTGKRKTTARGQQKIEPERAQAIQEALIREHYLSREAAGTWNQSSEEAMRRYQADHGWQSKTVPDSRALISLGLGPSHDHLLNPESAMVNGPFAPRSSSSAPVSHSADPGARTNTSPTVAPAAAPPPEHDSSGPQ